MILKPLLDRDKKYREKDRLEILNTERYKKDTESYRKLQNDTEIREVLIKENDSFLVRLMDGISITTF